MADPPHPPSWHDLLAQTHLRQWMLASMLKPVLHDRLAVGLDEYHRLATRLKVSEEKTKGLEEQVKSLSDRLKSAEEKNAILSAQLELKEGEKETPANNVAKPNEEGDALKSNFGVTAREVEPEENTAQRLGSNGHRQDNSRINSGVTARKVNPEKDTAQRLGSNGYMQDDDGIWRASSPGPNRREEWRKRKQERPAPNDDANKRPRLPVSKVALATQQPTIGKLLYVPNQYGVHVWKLFEEADAGVQQQLEDRWSEAMAHHGLTSRWREILRNPERYYSVFCVFRTLLEGKPIVSDAPEMIALFGPMGPAACQACMKARRPCGFLVEEMGEVKLGLVALPSGSRGCPDKDWNRKTYWITK